MGAQGRVADCISPVHETVLNIFRYCLKPRRYFGKRNGVPRRALQRILFKLVVGEGSTNPPIRAAMVLSQIRINEMPLAKAPDLIVDGVKNSERMPRPVAVRIRFWSDLLAGIAHQEGSIWLRNGLKSPIVVYSSIAQDRGLREWFSVQVGTWSFDDRLFDDERGRRQDGGNAEDAATAAASDTSGLF
jgi:hypothetical protein